MFSFIIGTLNVPTTDIPLNEEESKQGNATDVQVEGE